MGNPNLPSTKTGFLPWEAMNTGRPDRPNYITDPNSIQGFDSSALKQSRNERLGMQGQQAAGQYLAGQSKLMGGVGRSSGASTGLQDIATETARAKAASDAELDWKDYQSRRELMDALNGIKSKEYGGAMDEFQNEQGQRQAGLGSILNLAGMAGGTALAGGFGGNAAPPASDYTQQLIDAGLDPYDVYEMSQLKKRR